MNKKEIIKILLASVLILIGVGIIFFKSGNSAIDFKNEYESLNGKKNSNGLEHRTVSISINNPYQKVKSSDILEKIKNKETFYVYFGDKLCPWCRSVIEKSIEVAKNKNIDKIYYVNIWDDNGDEILRDKYELQNGEIVKVIEGTSDYNNLLKELDNVLKEYTLMDNDGIKLSTGEKRIYAPTFIYIENGVAIKSCEGISEKQTDSREKLSKEILSDEEKIFNEFFE